jgi:signal peptidase II
MTALIAGGLGNFLDRVRLGYVVDFLSFRCGFNSQTWVLPSFNVADIIIVLSLILVIHTLIFENPHKSIKTGA